jgi:hypothetical protein
VPENGKEGVDGSSPSEGFVAIPDWHWDRDDRLHLADHVIGPLGHFWSASCGPLRPMRRDRRGWAPGAATTPRLRHREALAVVVGGRSGNRLVTNPDHCGAIRSSGRSSIASTRSGSGSIGLSGLCASTAATTSSRSERSSSSQLWGLTTFPVGTSDIGAPRDAACHPRGRGHRRRQPRRRPSDERRSGLSFLDVRRAE